MRASTVTIALALAASAAPALAVPVVSSTETVNAIVESDVHSFDARAFDEAYSLQSRELEARFKLPTGLLAKLKGPLVKELGSGLLTGGAFAGLAAFLGGGSDKQPARRSFDFEGVGKRNAGELGALTRRAARRRSFELEARELEARFKLPTGLLAKLKGPLVKELGSGLLTGGAFAGLAGLLGGSSSQPQQPQARAFVEESDDIAELHRRGLSALLTKLVGQEGKLSTIIKNSIFGGLASGAVIGTGQAVAGQNGKREEELSDDDKAVLLALLGHHEKRALGASLGKLLSGEAGVAIKKGLVNGFGSAVGGLGIGALIDKFSHKSAQPAAKREEPELTDEDIKTLLSLMPSHDKRALAGGLSKLFKGPAGLAIKKGLVNGLGSAFGGLGIGALIDHFTKSSQPAPAPAARREFVDLETREPLKLNAIGKGLIGTGVGLGASTLASQAIEEIKKLFSRELLEELEAREPAELGADATTLSEEGLAKLREIFGRELELESLNDLD